MHAQATARNVRVTPRKARLVADLIRGQNVVRAMALLSTLRNRAAEPVMKVLQSALANADQRHPDAGLSRQEAADRAMPSRYRKKLATQ